VSSDPTAALPDIEGSAVLTGALLEVTELLVGVAGEEVPKKLVAVT
jgi:hypothetical protein